MLGLARCSLDNLGPPRPVSLQSSPRSTCRPPWPSANAEKPQVWAAAKAQPVSLPALSKGRNEFLPAAATAIRRPRRTNEVFPHLDGLSPTGREEPRHPHQELNDIEPSAARRNQGPSEDKGEWEGERSGRACYSHQWRKDGAVGETAATNCVPSSPDTSRKYQGRSSLWGSGDLPQSSSGLLFRAVPRVGVSFRELFPSSSCHRHDWGPSPRAELPSCPSGSLLSAQPGPSTLS